MKAMLALALTVLLLVAMSSAAAVASPSEDSLCDLICRVMRDTNPRCKTACLANDDSYLPPVPPGMTHDSFCADVCVASGRTSSESCIDDCKFYIPFPPK